MATTPNKNYELPDKGAKNWHVDLNANFTAIDSDVNDLDTEVGDARASSVYTDESPFASLDARLEEIEDELKQARLDKTLSTDRLRDILLVGHNSDGTNKSGSFTFDQWENALMSSPAYASAQTITVSGDVTATLQPGTSLKAEFAVSGLVYLHVKSSSYSAPNTTVTVWDDETVLNETINSLHYGVYRNNLLGAAGIPGASIRALENASFDLYYYDATSYDNPWDETGGRVAKTNGGSVARIDYASGLSVGTTYDSANDDAEVAQVERKINGVSVETQTPTYDPTTGLITDYDRS